MDNMKEMRNKVQDGKYNLTLDVAEGAYFGTYDDVDTKSGEDLVRNYLRSNSDDANFNDIKIKYNKNADIEYSSNSVFCSKGQGIIVPWNEVEKYMHCEIFEE